MIMSAITCPNCQGGTTTLIGYGIPYYQICQVCKGSGKYRIPIEELYDRIQHVIDNLKEPVEMEEKKTFIIKVEGNFVPTTTYVKNKLGLGYNVLSIEVEREFPSADIKDAESAVKAIIYTGHRELVRRHHPDVAKTPCNVCNGNGQVVTNGIQHLCPRCAGFSQFSLHTQTMININQGKKQLDELMKAVEAATK